jgi:hypothetical protein
MAIALFGGDDFILLDGIEVDAKTGEFHSFEAAPTSYAIEGGAVTSDHIVELPDRLEVSFILSNFDEDGSSYGNRAANALDNLRDRIKKRALYEVVTRHQIYPSMAVTSLRAEHSGSFSGAIRGHISFVEVQKDRLQRVRLAEVRVPRKKTAAADKDAGRVEAKEPDAADKKGPRAGFIKQVLGAIR